MATRAIFSHEELLQIALLCRIGAEGVSVVDDNILLRIWQKIADQLSVEEKQDIEANLNRHLARLNGSEASIEDVEAGIEMAIKTGQRLRIKYFAASSQQMTERIIRPMEILHEPQGSYIMAWCELRGEERKFRLDRIGGIVEIMNMP